MAADSSAGKERVAIFEAGIVQTTSPGTISTQVWNPSGTSTTTYGPLGSVPSTTVFHDLLAVNQGTCNLYLGFGSAAAATVLGVLLPVGGQMYLGGYGGTVGTAGTLWANTGTVGLTGAIAVGMPSVASVI
jgi:hypothetical protein